MTAEVTAEEFTPEATYNAEAEADDGSTESIQLEIGEVVPADEAPQLAGFPDAASVCTLEPQRDALIPARATVVNTTDSFNVDVSAAIKANWPLLEYGVWMSADELRSEMSLLSASEYSDGPDCSEPTAVHDSLMGVSFEQVQPGGEREHSFWFVLSNYFGPSVPEGNSDSLERSVLHFDPYTDTGGMWEVTCLSGPGVHDDDFTLTGVDAAPAKAYLEDVSVSDLVDDEIPDCR